MEIPSPLCQHEFIHEHERRVLHLSAICERCDTATTDSDGGEIIGNGGRGLRGNDGTSGEKETRNIHLSPDLHCRGISQQPCTPRCPNAQTCLPHVQTCARFGNRQNNSCGKDQSATAEDEVSTAKQLPSDSRRYFRDNFFSVLHSTRLKLTRSPQAVHFVSFLLVNFLYRRLRETKIFRSLVLGLLLFSALILPTVVAQDGMEYRQKSHSGSPFEAWLSGEIEPVPISGIQQSEVFRFPDFVLPVSKLFQFELPRDAFRGIGVVELYKVRTPC